MTCHLCLQRHGHWTIQRAACRKLLLSCISSWGGPVAARHPSNEPCSPSSKRHVSQSRSQSKSNGCDEETCDTCHAWILETPATQSTWLARSTQNPEGCRGCLSVPLVLCCVVLNLSSLSPTYALILPWTVRRSCSEAKCLELHRGTDRCSAFTFHLSEAKHPEACRASLNSSSDNNNNGQERLEICRRY